MAADLLPSSSGLDPEASVGPTLPRRLVATCRAFDEAWRNGERPRIEEVLQETRPDDRTTLLAHLVRIEVRHRAARGETPVPDEYVSRFPSDRETILGIDWDSLTPGGRKAAGPQTTILSVPPRQGRIARFELIERVGAGGFGEVWRAFDPHLQREVALKLGHFAAQDGDSPDLMLHEARSAGRLQHPSIVRVHEAGVEGDVAYIVSDYIAGTTLDKKIKEGPLSPNEAAELAKTLAEALAHAHDRGIVHRDIKPANVLLDRAGQPHLTDFGVARRAAGDATISKNGQALGTPAYMAPEQARGETAAVDPRADVYSLGLVLYEMLAGRRAYPGDAREALCAVQLGPPEPLRAIFPGVPADMEKIVEVAVTRERGDRYPTAAAIADDLGRYLRGEPVLARPLGRVTRCWRWARRRPAAVLAILFVTSACAVVAPFLIEAVRRPPGTEFASIAGPPVAPPLAGGDPAAGAGVLEEAARPVVIETNPPGARVWVIPRDRRTGWVRPEALVDFGISPARRDLAPGEYLVVAKLSDDRFNEVWRWVPYPEEKQPGFYNSLFWERRESGEIALAPIAVPIVATPLVQIPAGELLVVAENQVPRTLFIPEFEMMPREFAIGDLLSQPRANVSSRLGELAREPEQALPFRYDDALGTLEKAGLRLPDEYEWERIARWDEPNWSVLAEEERGQERFGPAGTPESDATGPGRAILGLRSNVAEWTSSWWAPQPWVPGEEISAGRSPQSSFIVRGGDSLVQGGLPIVSSRNRDVKRRYPVGRFSLLDGVGFRGVRSVKPRRDVNDFVRDLGPSAREAGGRSTPD